MVLYLFEVYLLVGSAVAVVALALWVSFYLALLGTAVTLRFLRVRYPQKMAGNFLETGGASTPALKSS